MKFSGIDLSKEVAALKEVQPGDEIVVSGRGQTWRLARVAKVARGYITVESDNPLQPPRYSRRDGGRRRRGSVSTGQAYGLSNQTEKFLARENRMVRLPENKKAREVAPKNDGASTRPKIASMEPGEVGYAVPWAMAVVQGVCYVSGDSYVYDAPYATVSMRVTLLGDGALVVDISGCGDYLWPETAALSDVASPIPVTKLFVE